MKNQVANRRDYSVFILDSHSQFFVKRKEVFQQLKSVYPFEVSEDQVFIKKMSKKLIVFVVKDIDVVKQLIPTLYLMENAKKDEVLWCKYDESTFEKIVVENGQVQISSVYNKINNSDNEKVVFLKDVNLKNKQNYYLKKNYSKKDKIRILVLLLILFCSIFALVFQISKTVKSQNIENERIIQEKKKSQEEQKLLKIQQKNVEELKAEYELLAKNKNLKVFSVLSVLYQCLQKDTTIKTIFVNDNNFSLEVTCKNPSENLKKFETNKNISSIKLTRISSVKDMQLCQFTGSLYKNVEYCKSSDLLEQEDFYQKEIENLSIKKSNYTLSNWTNNYIQIFENLCIKNEYFDIGEINRNVTIENAFKCPPQDLIQIIQKIENEKFDCEIVSMRARFLEDSNIYCVIKVDTNIENTNDKNFLQENKIIRNVSKEELSKMFGQEQKVKESIVKESKVPEIIVHTGQMKFLGEGKNSEGKRIGFFKDEKSGKTLKLEIFEVKQDFDCCVKKENCYLVYIENQIFEVKK